MSTRRRLNLAFAIACLSLVHCASKPLQPVVHALPTRHAPKADDCLRVATVNMWGVALPGIQIELASYIDERFTALAERLARNEHALDVVLVQEAWSDSGRQILLDHTGLQRAFPYRVNSLDAPGGAGLVTLSRYPLTDRPRFHRFDEQGSCWKFWEGDCLGRKGVLAVEVEWGSRRVWVGNTHLIACYSADRDERSCDRRDPNGSARTVQTIEARRFMEEIGDGPMILGGDFNFTRTAERYVDLMECSGWSEPGLAHANPEGLDYVWARSAHGLRFAAEGGDGMPGQMQRIFDEPVRICADREVELTDHDALMVTYCLRSGRTDAGATASTCAGAP